MSESLAKSGKASQRDMKRGLVAAEEEKSFFEFLQVDVQCYLSELLITLTYVMT